MSSEEKNTNEVENSNTCQRSDKDDNELDELLDNALEDFSKPIPVSTTKPSNPEDATKNEGSEGNPPTFDGANWCEEFLKPNSAALEEAIQSILNDDPELAEGVKKIAELTSKAANGDVTDSDINSLAQEFLSNLTQTDDEASAGDLSSVPGELSKMFENLKASVTPTDSSFPEVTSAMQTIMQMLLSKDLLYPALQDIAEKYPDWLAENRPTLETEKYEAFNRQYHIIKQICDEFEVEPADNEEGTKRYEKILDLMQKMQECGQPPAELIGDMGNCTKFDGSNLPNLSGLSPDSNNQCVLM